MTDLRQRVPGHSLIDELIRQWELGNIHVDEQANSAVIDEEAHGWYRGVLGERRIAELLERLTDGVVLHSVPVGTGTTDIDHVVIGQAGVFTINTKYSPGRDVWVAGRGMYVGGHKQFYVQNSLNEARRASELLSQASGLTVPVVGIIVFVDPARMTEKAKPGGGDGDPEIRVVRHSELLLALRGRTIFNREQVERIAHAAIRAETWHRSPAESTVGTSIAREFLALEEALGPRLALEYAAPVGVAASPRSARSRAVSRPANRNTRRRPKKTKLEVLLSGLILPVAMILGSWIWLSTLMGK